MSCLPIPDNQIGKARLSSFTKKFDKQGHKSHYYLIVGLQGGQPFFQHQLGGANTFLTKGKGGTNEKIDALGTSPPHLIQSFIATSLRKRKL